jgi:hypothetical protein
MFLMRTARPICCQNAIAIAGISFFANIKIYICPCRFFASYWPLVT